MPRFRPRRRLGAALALLLLAACSSSSDGDGVLLSAAVSAGGGTFQRGGVTVIVPAGAISGSARLQVTAVPAAPGAGAEQREGSPAYTVSLRDASGAPAALAAPMSVQIAVASAPVHPETAELATLADAGWQRLGASFWKPAAGAVLGLTSASEATYRVIHRARALATGPAVARGRDVMLYETFGNEAFFGAVGLHEVLNGVAPASAVALGAQVDLARVPADVAAVMTGDDLAAKDAALLDPAVTRKLVKAGAVIGVKGVYATQDRADDTLIGAGITCALCHVKVTPTTFQLSSGPAALPIGAIREDGVPNEKMDAGKILSFTPFAQAAGPETVALLAGWGPNRFDIRALPDNAVDDGVDDPTDTPPLWNFLDLEAQGYALGWDGLWLGDDALASQAEAVYDVVMHANGAFGTAHGTLPPALAVTPPQALLDALAQAEADAPGNDVRADALLDLQAWMRSIASPAPGTFDEAKADMGFRLFHGRALCATCHSTPDLAGPGLFTGITAGAPAGGLAGGIHVPSLRGVAASAPYFHDDSAADLPTAVDRVATVLAGLEVALSPEDRAAIVEYLKSL
jgi:hypothetical protein